MTPERTLHGHADPPAGDEAARGPERRPVVLVVDDEPMIRKIAARIIEAAGYDVTVAVDGVDMQRQCQRAAIERWPEAPFDAIVSDVDMPRCDGIAALAALRACGIETPVILVSGRFDDDLRARGLALGAAAVLAKPFEVEVLEAVLATACARRVSAVAVMAYEPDVGHARPGP